MDIALARILVVICFLSLNNGLETKKQDLDIKNCNHGYRKIGCFKEGVTKVMLINDRDVTSFAYDGHIFNWTRVEYSLRSLLCRCARKARKSNFKYIGIRFYAECYGGQYVDNSDMTEGEGCAQEESAHLELKCEKEDDDDCTGSTSEYVFEVLPTNVDGGYTTWSHWSKCMAACGDGIRMRNRYCSNPAPGGTGKDCKSKGRPLQIIACSKEPCPK